jgi:hypothetical protein
MPRETLRCLLDLDMPVQFIQGNCEIDALAEMRSGALRVRNSIGKLCSWSAEQIYPEYEQMLAGWSKTPGVEMGG